MFFIIKNLPPGQARKTYFTMAMAVPGKERVKWTIEIENKMLIR